MVDYKKKYLKYKKKYLSLKGGRQGTYTTDSFKKRASRAVAEKAREAGEEDDFSEYLSPLGAATHLGDSECKKTLKYQKLKTESEKVIDDYLQFVGILINNVKDFLYNNEVETGLPEVDTEYNVGEKMCKEFNIKDISCSELSAKLTDLKTKLTSNVKTIEIRINETLYIHKEQLKNATIDNIVPSYKSYKDKYLF